jgi:hypothetical protein
MPAARYWRIIGIETYGGGDLELSEVALYDGVTRVDGSATLTSSHAPIAGSLANLKDADTGTTARFAGADVFLPGFALQWDFGSAQNVTAIRFGRGASSESATFPSRIAVQSSTNGDVWTTESSWSGVDVPSQGALSAPLVFNPGDLNWSNVLLLLKGEGTVGSETITDSGPLAKTVTVNSSRAAISNEQFRHGASSIKCTAGYAGIEPAITVSSVGTDFFDGDYCVEMWINVTAYNGNSIWLFGMGSPKTLTLNFGGTVAFSSDNWPYTNVNISHPTAVQLNQWTHIALTKNSSTVRVFVNGVGTAGVSEPTAWNVNTANATFGGETIFFDEYRITKGAARYTANFTPTPKEFPPGDQATLGDASGASTPLPLRTSTSQPTLISEYTPPPFTTTTAQPVLLDLTFGGAATVTGTVKRYDDPAFVPVARRVRLYDEQARQMAREAWSDPATGAFTFTGVRADRKYTVMALDHLGQYRAVIIDRVEAV